MNFLNKESSKCLIFHMIWLITDSAFSQQRVQSIASSMIGTYTKDLIMQWQITTSNTEQIKRFLIFFKDKNQIIEGDLTNQLVLNQGETMFDSRIEASFQNNIYKVTINNLHYKDIGSFRLTMGYGIMNSANVPYYESSDVIIRAIYGGPVLIGDQIPATFTFDENTSPLMSLQVQGNPPPIVSVKFAERTITTKMKKEKDYYIFKYAYELTKLEPKHCGITQIYNITGYLATNSIITSSKVYVSFIPNHIAGVRLYKSDGNCVTAEWDLLDTGYCDMMYSIQYSTNGKLIKTIKVTLKYDLKTYKYETCNGDLVKSTAIIVWATYNGKEGSKSFATITATDSNSSSSCWLIAGPIIAILILLIIISIIFILVGVITVTYKGCACRNHTTDESLAMSEHHDVL